MKAQTMLISLVLVVFVILGTLVMLISTVDVLGADDYIKLHANSLLTALLKTDSGYGGDVDKCRTFADILFCAGSVSGYSGWTCGSATCDEIATVDAKSYINKALDPKLTYYLKYGEKEIGPSKDLTEKKSGVTKVVQKISKGGDDMDVTFLVGEKVE